LPLGNCGNRAAGNGCKQSELDGVHGVNKSWTGVGDSGSRAHIVRQVTGTIFLLEPSHAPSRKSTDL
jgi:hypothetical protein